MYVLILAKTVLGYILGDFFTNASGHPGTEALAKTRCHVGKPEFLKIVRSRTSTTSNLKKRL
jgi:hypothetical protein